MKKKTRILRGLLATLALIQIVACRKTTNQPTKEAREDFYSLIHSAINMGTPAIVVDYLSDDIEAQWDGALVIGADSYSREWRRVTNGARIQEYRRSIMKETQINKQSVRDSGYLSLRLGKGANDKAPRDTILNFVSYWALEGNPKAWRLIRDSLFATPK